MYSVCVCAYRVCSDIHLMIYEMCDAMINTPTCMQTIISVVYAHFYNGLMHDYLARLRAPRHCEEREQAMVLSHGAHAHTATVTSSEPLHGCMPGGCCV